MSILAINLKGAFQSWSTEFSNINDRATREFPTLSGIVGMLGNAMGLSREDTVEYFSNIKMAVRRNKIGNTIKDFQTTYSPYKEYLPSKNKWKLKHYWKTAENKIKDAIDITRMEYLTDTFFTVYIEMTEDKLRVIQNYLKHPVRQIFLGKKKCLPSIPIRGRFVDYSSLEEAVRNDIPADNDYDKLLSYIIDDKDGLVYINDIPVDFTNHIYHERRVNIKHFTNPYIVTEEDEFFNYF